MSRGLNKNIEPHGRLRSKSATMPVVIEEVRTMKFKMEQKLVIT